MSSSVRRDLTAAVLDHQDLGQVCVEVLEAATAQLAEAGFEQLYRSGTGVEDLAFGTELLCYARLQSTDRETPIALCVRLICSATSKPRLTCSGTLELHRNEAPERPKRDGDSLVDKLALVFLQGEGDAGMSEEEHCRTRHEALCKAMRDNIEVLSSGKARQFVEDALAP